MEFINLKRSTPKLLSLLLITVVNYSIPLHANENTQPETPQPEYEKIEVIGAYPLSFFEREMHQAQVQMLKTYNELAGDDLFKAKCRKIMYTGSRKRHRVCSTNYVKKTSRLLYATKAELTGNQFSQSARASEINAANRDIRAEHYKDIIRLYRENDVFRASVENYLEKSNAFKAKKAKQ